MAWRRALLGLMGLRGFGGRSDLSCAPFGETGVSMLVS